MSSPFSSAEFQVKVSSIMLGDNKGDEGDNVKKNDNREFVEITSSLPRRFRDNCNIAREETCPQDHLIKILESRGYSTEVKSSMLELPSSVTEQRTKAYDNDAIALVVSRNIDKLSEKYSAGKCVNPYNKFGESLLHMACRRGFTDVVAFFIKDCEESVRVRDDYGRTPLHDCFWTVEPQFDLIRLLVGLDPSLLLYKDKRNHCPLEYVREQHWGSIKKFLSDNAEVLFPIL